jgi:hypothetical protein
MEWGVMYFNYSLIKNYIHFWPEHSIERQKLEIKKVGNIYNQKYFQLHFDEDKNRLAFHQVDLPTLAGEIVQKAIREVLLNG